ncbi:unnamed protein product [Kuraishia capsulata CBS 1993]|uniref:separase n=1 Tax=Kuraishia capsulata CBS 1993 TaxID=1382522 RepID=W6MPL5_9ASCO|nr:uncharacterized protein KUCA_T00004549001 [Kuraishia capsulata CBS 1993]CDK28566.1 unnamed protein product [Kuraishia capsulata CBS 1993]
MLHGSAELNLTPAEADRESFRAELSLFLESRKTDRPKSPAKKILADVELNKMAGVKQNSKLMPLEDHFKNRLERFLMTVPPCSEQTSNDDIHLAIQGFKGLRALSNDRRAKSYFWNKELEFIRSGMQFKSKLADVIDDFTTLTLATTNERLSEILATDSPLQWKAHDYVTSIPVAIGKAKISYEFADLHLLICELMINRLELGATVDIPLTHFIKMMSRTSNFFGWITSLPEEKLQLISRRASKGFMRLANCTKTVLKLGFFIKALEFGQKTVMFEKEVLKLKLMYDTMVLKNKAQVYQYTSLPFWDLCESLSQQGCEFSTEMIMLVQNYDKIKTNSLNWRKFLNRAESSASEVPIEGVLQELQIQTDTSVQALREKIFESGEEFIQSKSSFSSISHSLNQLLKDPDSSRAELLGLIDSILEFILRSGQVTRYHYPFLDNITLLLKSFENDLENEAGFVSNVSKLIDILKGQGQLKRMRNFSNLLFQSGTKLLPVDVSRAIAHWNKCVEAEVLNFEGNSAEIEMLKAKTERISNALIEAGNPHDGSSFLVTLLQVYQDRTGEMPFFELLPQFRDEMAIPTKLLSKAILQQSDTLSVIFTPEILSDTTKAVLAVEILETLGGYAIKNRISLFLGLAHVLTTEIKDKGLLLICLLKVHDVIPTETLLFEQLCDFDFESSVGSYEAVILSKAYLKMCVVSSSFHKTKLLQGIERFLEAAALPPSHCTLFYELEVLNELFNYLVYTGLHAYASYMVSQYLDNRKSCLTEEKLIDISLKLSEVKLYLKFPLQVSNSLTSTGVIMKGSKEKVEIMPLVNWKLQQLEYLIETGNLSHAKQKCQLLLDWFSETDELHYEKARNKYRSVETLFEYARLQYLVSRLQSEENRHVQAVSGLKRSIKILQNILQKFIPSLIAVDAYRSNQLRWRASSYLINSFKVLISVLIHIGSAKECDFYVNELMALVSLQDFNLVKAELGYFIANYKLLSGKIKDANDLIAAADEDFNSSVFTNKFVELQKLETHALLSQLTQNQDLTESYYSAIDDLFEFLKSDNSDEHGLRDQISDEFVHSAEEHTLIERARLSIEFQRSMSALNGALARTSSENSCKQSFQYDALRSASLKGKMMLSKGKRFIVEKPEFSGLEDSAIVLNSVCSSENETKSLKSALGGLFDSKDLLFRCMQNGKYFKGYEYEEVLKTYLCAISYSGAFTGTSLKVPELMFTADSQKYTFFQNDKQLQDMEEQTKSLLPSPKSLTFELDTRSISSDMVKLIPQNWKVISIDICSITGDLLISSFQPSSESQIYARLPLNRHAARDVNERSLTFLDGLKELKTIIHESDQTTDVSRTSKVKTKEDRAEWWKERGELDLKLQNLICDAEYLWLGGFRSIFNTRKIDPHDLQDFKLKFLDILAAHLPSRNTTRSLGRRSTEQVELSDTIYELFLKLGLPSKLERIEFLEDLMYFVLDILLFHGEENAYDEIDLDQLYIDIESLIELSVSHMDMKPHESEADHIVLVLSSACQYFPWESLPILRDLSVSRMPSFKLLLQVLENHGLDPVDANSGYYVLNPGGDLNRTEKNFKDSFEALPGWTGRSGEPPSENELITGIANSGLFAYLGHGGGEQYIKSKTIKAQSRCAPALLLGCSSGALRANGVLESYGTVYNYLVGGSPMVLASMWDVTDKDMDRFTGSMLDQWGLFPKSEVSCNKTIGQALPEARDTCTLKYLNGAAPVLYGLPLHLVK